MRIYKVPKRETNQRTTERRSKGKKVAVYYRQSTIGQLGNVSSEMQLEDLPQQVIDMGWSADDVILIDSDAAVSGRLGIRQRQGMSYLYDLIVSGEIDTVFAIAEDRLFRDDTYIESNIFIKALKDYDVHLIAGGRHYDLNDPDTGILLEKILREKFEEASNYLRDHIKQRLLGNKNKRHKQGRWVGSNTPIGYMVNVGVNKGHPDYKKFVPFEPYAEIIRKWFDIFVNIAGGNQRRFLEYIKQHHIGITDYRTVKVPDGFKISHKFKVSDDGLHYPQQSYLPILFTNAVYIGHWIIKNEVVIERNHPAIVSDELFFAAFNYLSKYTLNGEPNENYKPVGVSRRQYKENRPEYTPLLENFIGYIDNNNQHRFAHVHYQNSLGDGQYVYAVDVGSLSIDKHWFRACSYVDDAISFLLKEKLTATFDDTAWQQALDEMVVDYSKDKNELEEFIAQANRELEATKIQLATLSLPELIQDAEKRYEAILKRKAKYEDQLASLKANDETNEMLFDLRDKFTQVLSNWDSMSNFDKRPIVYSQIKSIMAEKVSGNLQLTIQWVDNTEQTVTLYRQGVRDQWSFAETYTLERLLDANASQLEIGEYLPEKTWKSIHKRIARIDATRIFRPKPIRDYETYNEYLQRIADEPDLYNVIHWSEGEINRLKDMLENGCDKLDLVIAFPDRKWTHIRKKVSEIKGKQFDVTGDKIIRYNQCLNMYLADNDISLSDFCNDHRKVNRQQLYYGQFKVVLVEPLKLNRLVSLPMAA